jgi:fluoride ion exporter CrcB/FEX
MADEVFDSVPIRVVRSEDQGAYLIQIGVEGAYRTFASMKLGKLDFLRDQARVAAASQPSTSSESVPPPPAQ